VREKRKYQADRPEKWDESRVRTAQAAASCHAARFARQRRLPSADREDLAQDILVAIIEASPQFDAARGAWATFVALLARRAVIDRARQAAAPELVSIDAPAAASLRQTMAAPQADLDIAVAFGRAQEDLPPAAHALLRRIMAHRDVAAARDAGSTSPATFYRELHDLRCWLRALGARPAAPATKAAMPSRRSGS
jgi:DNA-directed RNA polymerase specialized sigma24 family protein